MYIIFRAENLNWIKAYLGPGSTKFLLTLVKQSTLDLTYCLNQMQCLQVLFILLSPTPSLCPQILTCREIKKWQHLPSKEKSLSLTLLTFP